MSSTSNSYQSLVKFTYEANTRLADVNTYNPEKSMVFSKLKLGQIPNQKIPTKRIMISSVNDDGTVGELCIRTPVLPKQKGKPYQPECFSTGLKLNKFENKDDGAGGYTLPIHLSNQDGSLSERQKQFLSCFKAITDNVKKFLLKEETRKEVGAKFKFSDSDLAKIDTIWYKCNDNGDRVEGAVPILYGKVYDKKPKLSKDTWGDKQIAATFFDIDKGVDIDPLTLLDKHCNVSAVIKFESIYFGAKISLQVKIVDVQVKMLGGGRISLLPRDESDDENEEETKQEPEVVKDEPESKKVVVEFEEEEEVVKESKEVNVVKELSDDSDEEETKPVVSKPVAKKTVAKKK